MNADRTMTLPLPRDAARVVDRRRLRSILLIAGLLAALIASILLGVGIGAVPITPHEVLATLGGACGLNAAPAVAPEHQAILLRIRLPRVLLGVMVGALLGGCGALSQGLFRNPLAEPSLIGISSGAALAVVTLMLCSQSMGPAWLDLPITQQLAAFFGGLVATLMACALAHGTGRTSVATLLLSGIAINALAAAFIGLAIFLADDRQLRSITFWMMGSLGAATWPGVITLAVMGAAIMCAMIGCGSSLNALALGEAEAHHLGLAVERFKLRLTLLIALGVGASVALTGMIGFLGLIVPHLMRLLGGSDHRFVLPASLLGGAVLLVLADLGARTIAVPQELPIGMLTSLVGAPVFVAILLRRRRGLS